MSDLKFKIGDRVEIYPDGPSGTIVAIDREDAYPYLVAKVGGQQCYYALGEAVLLDPSPLRPVLHLENERDRLNAEADCYRKEAQEARALQRKFYDEVQELRRLLAQVTAERDAANQQCACAVQKLDDLRACLKALAR